MSTNNEYQTVSQLVTPEEAKARMQETLRQLELRDHDPEIQAHIAERERRARLTVQERIKEDGVANPPTVEEAQRAYTLKVWTSLIGKCNDKQHLHYRHWGAQGIRMCDAWAESFEAFIVGVGLCPSPYFELHRINQGNPVYEPDNAVWKERRGRTYRPDGKHPGGRPRKGQQALVEYEGKQVTLPELSQLTGIKLSTLRSRYSAGKTLDQMLVPVRLNATGEAWNVTFRGDDSGVSQLVTLKDMCKAKGVPYATVKARLKKGVPLAQALHPKKPTMTHEERKQKQRDAYYARKAREQQEAQLQPTKRGALKGDE